MELNVLLEMKEYIEDFEEFKQEEPGTGYELADLIELNKMPALYYKILKEIETLNNKG